MHIYQLLPYVLNTSFSTHPKRLTWEKASPLLHFRHYATYRKLRKKIQKKIRKFFFSIFSFLRAFVVSSCRKSGFRVFLSLRYGADLGRSRLVLTLRSITCLWILSLFFVSWLRFNWVACCGAVWPVVKEEFERNLAAVNATVRKTSSRGDLFDIFRRGTVKVFFQ